MRVWSALVAALLLLATPLGAGQDPSRADADRMSRKLQAILARGIEPPSTQPRPVSTSFTEAELNAYLRLAVEADLPVGLRQPTVTMLDGGRLDTRALVDLDRVREAEKRGWLDPLAFVAGILEVRAVGVFHGEHGKGVYAFESATLGGVPVPKKVLQELLAFYTRSPDAPSGIPLDAPFDLPARIRDVQVRRGVATVIQ